VTSPLRVGSVRLLTTLVIALGLIASACGSDDTSSSEPASDDSASTSTESSDSSEPADADTDAGADGEAASGGFGTLDFLGWEGYDTFFGANADALGELGIDFNSTAMASPADIAQRFASGAGDGIDILAWTSANHAQYRGIDGTLCPITVDEVPNLDGLISQFSDDTWDQFLDDDGNWLAVPFSFAPLGITFDSSQVQLKSYADLLDPALQGQVGIPDVPGLHVQAAAAALDLDPNILTPDELDEVIGFMQQVWGQARVISPGFGDLVSLLGSGEIVAAYGGYPGLETFPALAENPDIVTVFPEEGTFSFVEVYSIPCGADNREGALAFVNAMLDPATNAAINDAFGQATTVQDAIALMSDANRDLYPYDSLDTFFADNGVGTLPGGANGVGMGEFIEAYGTLAAGG